MVDDWMWMTFIIYKTLLQSLSCSHFTRTIGFKQFLKEILCPANNFDQMYTFNF